MEKNRACSSIILCLFCFSFSTYQRRLERPDRFASNNQPPSVVLLNRLYIAASGQGSPCLDLRRVSAEVAEGALGADLVVIEGMGRAVHTNYNSRFRCAALKLAMLKNAHLAEKLFHGKCYDCICRFDPAP